MIILCSYIWIANHILTIRIYCYWFLDEVENHETIEVNRIAEIVGIAVGSR